MVGIMDREDIDIDSMSYDEFVIFTLRADRQHSNEKYHCRVRSIYENAIQAHG